eukprot:m51a1_g4666 Adaptor protein complex 3 (AP-3), sigma subunit (162) ;mRNA; f:103929-104789
MIKAILVINNHGKCRLSKFYSHLDEDKQQNVIREVYNLVSKRTERACNFLEAGENFWGRDSKIVYRHYATLFFIFVVDSSESELGILDLIQVFVETLDKCFENVCELDLIFHVDKIHFIADEIVQGGLVLETQLQTIVGAIEDQHNIEKKENPLKALTSRS